MLSLRLSLGTPWIAPSFLICQYNDMDDDTLYIEDGVIIFTDPTSDVGRMFDRSDPLKFGDLARGASYDPANPTDWTIADFTQLIINTWSTATHLYKIFINPVSGVVNLLSIISVKAYSVAKTEAEAWNLYATANATLLINEDTGDALINEVTGKALIYI